MEHAFVSTNIQGLAVRGTILQLTGSQLAFEIYHPNLMLRSSQVLDGFEIFIDGNLVYSGRAVISNLLYTGTVIACEAKLDEPGVQNPPGLANNGGHELRNAYDAFFHRWEGQARVRPDFKMAVLDLQGYLSELKLLLEQVELSIRAHPSGNRLELEQDIAQTLAKRILPHFDALHERFEIAAGQINEDFIESYQALVRRHLHPLVLCAPFAYRSFVKPLGYAGDYEIMNMIHRNTFEGASLYAKMVHFWLVKQWAAQSVRNRVAHMKHRLVEETLRVSREKRPTRFMSLGCGPAREVQDFVAESVLSDLADFTLIDFDAETMDHVASSLSRAKSLHSRQTAVHIRRMTANDIVKFSTQPSRNPLGANFDMIYCGGLFDYLSDRLCKKLVGIFYDWLAPGGRLVVANMNAERKPFRFMVELMLDWHLIYRDAVCMTSFLPEGVQSDSWSVVHEAVGANLFLEVRKPHKSS